MKVGLIYTSTTPELIADVEREVKKQLGEDVEMFSLQDPSILADVRAAGYVTAAPAARLIGMYMKAVEEGVDAMLNLCSSVGEVADCAQDAAKYLGVPIVRVDEEMCREAVRLGKRVGVMATLPTTLTPTKNTVARVAREMGAHVELVDCLVDGAFGLDQEQFKKRLTDAAADIIDQVDVVVPTRNSSRSASRMRRRTSSTRSMSSFWHRAAWPMPKNICAASMASPSWAARASVPQSSKRRCRPRVSSDRSGSRSTCILTLMKS